LQLANGAAPDLSRYGELLPSEAPRARVRVTRGDVPDVLARILAGHAVEDVSVEDPPLEEVIAEVFSRAEEKEGLGIRD